MRMTAMVLLTATLAATLALLAAAGGVAWVATIGCPNDPQNPGSCYGTEEADTMFGSAGREYMNGRLGEDVLYGRRGPDHLEGGDDADCDRIYGGCGSDQIWVNDPEDGYGRDEKYGGPGDG